MRETSVSIPGAKLIGGVWLPASEEHFVEMMLRNKRTHVEDGKHTYQWHKIQAALGFVPAGRRRVCLDIGAHVGLWAMWLVRYFRHVHSFEPVKLHADIYPHNMGGSDNWTLYRFALGAEAGRVAIAVPPEQTGNAHVQGAGDIPMVTLDSYGFEAVDLVKIDVEGYELPVVIGAADTLARCKPIVVVEQKGNDVKFYGERRDGALGFLKGLGMRPLRVISGDHILGW